MQVRLLCSSSFASAAQMAGVAVLFFGGCGCPQAQGRAIPLSLKSYSHLPIAFEANRGQMDPQARFVAAGPGYKLILKRDEAVLALDHGRKSKIPITTMI